ncbi:MAG: pentapeptide repeat-containing protein [Deltaproteobacteria bacterium]|nr:pentapeptide repeat-containing protein [Deltaproteobacteria bacterium]
MAWPEIYHGPGNIEIEVRGEMDVMGESERHVRITSPRGRILYRAVEPDEAVAFSVSGHRLYVQDKNRLGVIKTRVINTFTGRTLTRELPPLIGDDIVIVSDLIEAARGRLINGTRFTRVSKIAAKAPTMSSLARMAALEELLGEAMPRAAIWDDVMALFQYWDLSDIEEGVHRALALLDPRWDDFRVWRPWMDVQEPHPAWRLLVTGPEMVSLYRREIGDTGARELAQQSILRSVSSLSLVAAEIHAEGVSALVGPESSFVKLQELNLSDNEIGDRGALTLARSATLAGLTDLNIAGCSIGPKGAKDLAASPHLGALRRLIMSFNPIGDDGARALAKSPYLNPVDRPSSEYCHIVQSGLAEKIFDQLRGTSEPEPEPTLLTIDGRGHRGNVAFQVTQAAEEPGVRKPTLEVIDADFTGQDFLGKSYRDATFNDCDFSGVRLLTCFFRDTRFIDCVFTDADLGSTTFTDVHLDRCMFRAANLAGASFKKCTINAGHFGEGANLGGTNWSGTTLSKAYFRRASLVNAIFDQGTFVACDFRKAKLKDARFQGARFLQCDFRGADFGDVEVPDGVLVDCRL